LFVAITKIPKKIEEASELQYFQCRKRLGKDVGMAILKQKPKKTKEPKVGIVYPALSLSSERNFGALSLPWKNLCFHQKENSKVFHVEAPSYDDLTPCVLTAHLPKSSTE
jgi:hypothetical protein